MLAITMRQPWAQLLADGHQWIVTRSRRAPERAVGQRIAITSSARWPSEMPWEVRKAGAKLAMSYGAVVGSGVLSACIPILDIDDPTNREPHLLVRGRHNPEAMLICRPDTGHYGGGASACWYPDSGRTVLSLLQLREDAQ